MPLSTLAYSINSKAADGVTHLAGPTNSRLNSLVREDIAPCADVATHDRRCRYDRRMGHQVN